MNPRSSPRLLLYRILVLLPLLFAYTALGGPEAAKAYSKMVERALNRTGSDRPTLALGDLHLFVIKEGPRAGQIDWDHPSGQRFREVLRTLAKNKGRIGALLWGGDIFDAKGGPQDPAARLRVEREIFELAAEASGLPLEPAKSSLEANHVFIMGNHDLPVVSKVFEDLRTEYAEHIQWLESEGKQGKQAGAQSPLGQALSRRGLDITQLRVGPDHIVSQADTYLFRPIPNDALDHSALEKEVAGRAHWGFVATRQPSEAVEIQLRGVTAERYGRRTKIRVQHYPGRTSRGSAWEEGVHPVFARPGIGTGPHPSDETFASLTFDIHWPLNKQGSVLEPDPDAPSGFRVVENEPGQVFTYVDAGTVGSNLVGRGKDGAGKVEKSNNSMVLFDPVSGRFLHIGIDGKPYLLPDSEKTTELPFSTTGQSARDIALRKAVLNHIILERYSGKIPAHQLVRQGWPSRCPFYQLAAPVSTAY